MGAGNTLEHHHARPKSQSELLQQAMDIGLGFSESQLRQAIDQLIEVYGGVEEAYDWISHDKFIVLVEFILDNANSELQSEQSVYSLVDSENNKEMVEGDQDDNHVSLEKLPIKDIKCKVMEKPSIKKEEIPVSSSDSLGFSVNKLAVAGTLQSIEKSTKSMKASEKSIYAKSSNSLKQSEKPISVVSTKRSVKHTFSDDIRGIAPLNKESLKIGNIANKKDGQKFTSKPRMIVPNMLKGEGCSSADKRLRAQGRQNSPQKSFVEVQKMKNDSGVQVIREKDLMKRDGNTVSSDGHYNVNSVCSKQRIACTSRFHNSVKKMEKVDDQSFAKRDQDLDQTVDHSGSCKKGDRLSHFEAVSHLIAEARASMPTGCEDLASCHESVLHGVYFKNSELCDMTSKHGRLDMQRQIKHIRTSSSITDKSRTVGQAIIQDCGKSEKGHVHENMLLTKVESFKDGSSEAGETRKLKSCLTAQQKEDTAVSKRDFSGTQRDKTREEMHSTTKDDGQFVPEVVLLNASRDPQENSIPSDPGRSVLEQLEINLTAGDCESALQILRAWKHESHQVGTTKTLDESELLEAGREGGQSMLTDVPGKKKGFVVCYDISRGLEKLPISCVNEYNLEVLPEDFLYITNSVIAAAAHVDTSFSRIGDLHCGCSDDCLRSSQACKCTDATRGEYAYDENGRLIQRLSMSFQSKYATENGDFITECCSKCQCSINCGNRVVQRGITKRFQVFMTRNRKGWGVRALEPIPAFSFVFEYVGEINTNEEQFYRNKVHREKGVHTYTMNLDADFDMEERHFGDGLTDTEALVLDATNFGNVSRFVNHRCNDANLFVRPVQIETRDTHYYHAAFFAVRDIQEMEELTWDYGIDFNDNTHTIEAFNCRCNSSFCRDRRRKRKASNPLFVE